MATMDQIKTARSMMNYANQVAYMIHNEANKKGFDLMSEYVRERTMTKWEPVWDRAVAYCIEHKISKHQV